MEDTLKTGVRGREAAGGLRGGNSTAIYREMLTTHRERAGEWAGCLL